MSEPIKKHRLHQKVSLTPVQIAARQFRSHLSQISDMSSESLNNYMELVSSREEIRHMHMPTLAGLINFLHKSNLPVARETMKDPKFNFENMQSYILEIHGYTDAFKKLYEKRKATPGEEQTTLKERVRITLDMNTAATFVRYLYTLTRELTPYEVLVASKDEPEPELSDQEQDSQEDAYSEEDDDDDEYSYDDDT